MNIYLLSALSAIGGATLGLLSTMLIASFQHRQSVTLRLLDQYLEVRKEMVDTVSELTSLDINQELAAENRNAYRDSISKLFYKHYDFLPKDVLDALILLYVCLNKPGLYTIKNNYIISMHESEFIPFIESCCLFRNTAYLAALALKSKSSVIRGNEAINLHARCVLYTFNKFNSIDDLLKMIKKLKKISDF